MHGRGHEHADGGLERGLEHRDQRSGGLDVRRLCPFRRAHGARHRCRCGTEEPDRDAEPRAASVCGSSPESVRRCGTAPSARPTSDALIIRPTAPTPRTPMSASCSGAAVGTLAMQRRPGVGEADDGQQQHQPGAGDEEHRRIAPSAPRHHGEHRGADEQPGEDHDVGNPDDQVARAGGPLLALPLFRHEHVRPRRRRPRRRRSRRRCAVRPAAAPRRSCRRR